MYKIAICDDDKDYRTALINAIHEYETGEALLDEVGKLHDLLFLDIQMPGYNGNATAKKFRERNKNAVLVFCTNYQNPTSESFKVRPYRYIMKDSQNRMLHAEMPDIIEEMYRLGEVEYLDVTNDGTLDRIPIKYILYISVSKRGSVVYCNSKPEQTKIMCRETLYDLFRRLAEKGFEYAHNSYIVNMSNVIHIEKNVLTLCDRTQLNISRTKQKNFNKRFSEFLRVSYRRKGND